MKKSLLALAALTAFAGAASAQSSVTLFGIVDANVRSVDNGPAGKLRTQSTDGMSSSRFGVRCIAGRIRPRRVHRAGERAQRVVGTDQPSFQCHHWLRA